jgi:hypothetical protein
VDEDTADLLGEFTHGWYESIEFRVSINSHYEERVEARWQPSILEQLQQASWHIPAVGTEGGTPNKADSKPPCNLESLYLWQTCVHVVCAVQATGEPVKRLRGLRRQARLFLGYDAPLMVIKDTVCGTCGGSLTVARDASTSVRCIGTEDQEPCGTEYPRHTWIALLDGGVA